MPVQNLQQLITLTAGGGTVNLPVNGLSTVYTIDGVATLTSSWTIQSTGTPYQGTQYTFILSDALNVTGDNVTIFGRTLSQRHLSNWAIAKPIVICTYNGSSWDVKILSEESTVADIDGFGIEQTREYATIFEDFNVGAGAPIFDTGFHAPILLDDAYASQMFVTRMDLIHRTDMNSTSPVNIHLKGKIKYQVDETGTLPGLTLGSGNWLFKAITTDFTPLVPILHYQTTAAYYTSAQNTWDLDKPDAIKNINVFIGDPSGADTEGGIWFEVEFANLGASTTGTYVINVDLNLTFTP
jgi:hypothetical protein